MRFYKLPKTGAISDLTLDEKETPQPARGQVLVRMRAASLNYRDLMVVTGRYGRGGVAENRIPLSDGAGEVVEVGENVDRFAVGDRVAGIFMQNWLAGEVKDSHSDSALGGAIDGVLSEFVLFDQQGLVALPAHMDFAQGATLPCAAVTAWNALYHGRSPLKAGDSVLLLGTGGVSMFALQLAKAAGAEVIQTSSSDDKLARVRQLGADHVINYRDTPEWQDEVRHLTDGRGVDHVVEVGGAGTLARSLRATRTGGQVNLIGVLTGGEINPTILLGKSISLRGIYVGSRELFEQMNRSLSLHRIEPVIDTTFDFDNAPAALEHLASQQHLGKIVIIID